MRFRLPEQRRVVRQDHQQLGAPELRRLASQQNSHRREVSISSSGISIMQRRNKYLLVAGPTHQAFTMYTSMDTLINLVLSPAPGVGGVRVWRPTLHCLLPVRRTSSFIYVSVHSRESAVLVPPSFLTVFFISGAGGEGTLELCSVRFAQCVPTTRGTVQ